MYYYTGEKLLSQHQKNKLGILRDLMIKSRDNYIEALEIYFKVFNNEPLNGQDNALFKYDVWRARLDMAYQDMIKCFSKYNKAFNSYNSYYSVCLGG